MNTFIVINGIFEGTIFEGTILKDRVYNNATTGQSYPLENCVKLKKSITKNQHSKNIQYLLNVDNYNCFKYSLYDVSMFLVVSIKKNNLEDVNFAVKELKKHFSKKDIIVLINSYYHLAEKNMYFYKLINYIQKL